MASVQPNNVSGPVTLRQQCPGLTTTHDPWEGCAMASTDATRNTPETWKPIPSFEGIYEVSDKGRVRSLDRTIFLKTGRRLPLKGKILSTWKDRYGYPTAGLAVNRKTKSYLIHRLVLEAFVGPRPRGMECRHLDGNPENNDLRNLAYGTGSQNTVDQVEHGTHYFASKTHCPRGHVLEDPNLVASVKKQGYRSCLACGRATSYMYKKPHLSGKMEEISGQYYEQIMRQARTGQIGGAA